MFPDLCSLMKPVFIFAIGCASFASDVKVQFEDDAEIYEIVSNDVDETTISAVDYAPSTALQTEASDDTVDKSTIPADKSDEVTVGSGVLNDYADDSTVRRIGAEELSKAPVVVNRELRGGAIDYGQWYFDFFVILFGGIFMTAAFRFIDSMTNNSAHR